MSGSQRQPGRPCRVSRSEASPFRVRSPISIDGDTTDLADAIDPALVLLVADAGLGAINAVRLSLDALAPHGVVVFLNRFDPNDEVHVDWPVVAHPEG